MRRSRLIFLSTNENHRHHFITPVIDCETWYFSPKCSCFLILHLACTNENFAAYYRNCRRKLVLCDESDTASVSDSAGDGSYDWCLRVATIGLFIMVNYKFFLQSVFIIIHYYLFYILVCSCCIVCTSSLIATALRLLVRSDPC